MDALPSDSEPIGYLLKGPTLLPEPGNGWVVSGIDPRVRVGMFEEESTPVVSVIFDLTCSQNEVQPLGLLGSLDGFSQLAKRAVSAIEPSDLLPAESNVSSHHLQARVPGDLL